MCESYEFFFDELKRKKLVFCWGALRCHCVAQSCLGIEGQCAKKQISCTLRI